jgi:trimethyllysine dioxygenase
MAYIMPSHYGGFWDFTSDLKHSDTAYTPLPLPAHTDTTYYGQSAGLQLFVPPHSPISLTNHQHCLQQSETGGESLLVDGYKAAQILRDEHPDSYRILSRTVVPAHSAGDPNYFFQVLSKPVLCHDLVGTGELVQVRWNNDDRSTMSEFPSEGGVDGFYDAIRRWDEILRRKESEYWFQLLPGRALSNPHFNVRC